MSHIIAIGTLLSDALQLGTRLVAFFALLLLISKFALVLDGCGHLAEAEIVRLRVIVTLLGDPLLAVGH